MEVVGSYGDDGYIHLEALVAPEVAQASFGGRSATSAGPRGQVRGGDSA